MKIWRIVGGGVTLIYFWHFNTTMMWVPKMLAVYIWYLCIFQKKMLNFLFLLLQTTLNKLKSYPYMFNLEAKCNFLKNRKWQVIIALKITFVSMLFVLTEFLNAFVIGKFWAYSESHSAAGGLFPSAENSRSITRSQKKLAVGKARHFLNSQTLNTRKVLIEKCWVL